MDPLTPTRPGDADAWLPPGLTDAHCHLVLREGPDRARFEGLLTESDRPAATHAPYAQTPLGLAVRRWCAPALGLPAGSELSAYLARRSELEDADVRDRLLSSAGLRRLCVDTGIGGPGFVPVAELAAASVQVDEVVRLESLAERVAAADASAEGFADAFVDALRAAASEAVAVKSILAYRHGFDIPPERPEPREVAEAAGRWLRAGGRLGDPVLLRFLLWSAVDLGLPIQLHAGFGDPDLRLAAADPALLQPFVEAAEPSGTPLVLLHCYPYHRNAGYLAAVYPTVYADVGLTLSHVGARAPAVLGEFLELAPFGKLLFSTDAYGLPELYAVGAAQFRWALGRILDEWVSESACTVADAEAMAHRIGAGNADRLLR